MHVWLQVTCNQSIWSGITNVELGVRIVMPLAPGLILIVPVTNAEPVLMVRADAPVVPCLVLILLRPNAALQGVVGDHPLQCTANARPQLRRHLPVREQLEARAPGGPVTVRVPRHEDVMYNLQAGIEELLIEVTVPVAVDDGQLQRSLQQASIERFTDYVHAVREPGNFLLPPGRAELGYAQPVSKGSNPPFV